MDSRFRGNDISVIIPPMVLLHSEKIKFGTSAPKFSLPSVDGKTYSLDSFSGKKVLAVFFICNHCPYVQAIEERILALWSDLKNQSVQFVAICSNDATDYPDDSPQNLLKRWKEKPMLISHQKSA